ncbi:SprA-related family protein [Halomonas sp. FeN2]|uniref:Metalloprotease CJM1_0395 family protein n=1 Tax=Vreelandella neptunia TaxID=115551 RepID=A0ABZ0YMF6_9GAMM|nr:MULTISPECIES: putative metalloprotease CJM1_0395 family protein [Halomonas]MDN3560850.1 putative metalloprotease CJM1_0395 family protein [Halomonas neptunia]TDV97432.1 SprA family protein [Halomonas alkaliantarctica]UBR48299.1 SprA-related family protein [Halomonas sp. FeN2]WQH13161.1 putative metalloprotease CJM1_0395 family protein [Halomonas neptunia]
MAVSSISTVSYAAWTYPSANTMSPRVEQTAKGRALEEDTASTDDPKTTSASEESSSAEAGPKRADGTPMAPEEIQLLDQLKQTDREVRQHEMAHQTVGGAYTGGASYEYEVGPDGKRYAVAGEVPIDYGPVPNDPQATIEKMQTVIAAAMAPADPSPKDHQVAAQARQYLLEAKLEASMQRSEMEQARSDGAAVTASADESAAGEQSLEEQAA